jgi:hypothetical protein
VVVFLKESKNFFFEKKKQKTFAPGGVGDAVAKTRRTKSFLVLFFKKEPLACLSSLLLTAARFHCGT